MTNTDQTINDPAQDVLFEPFKTQMDFLAAVFSGQFRFILYGGAIRSGKTFAGLGALILLSRKYPGSRWAVVRKDLQVIKQNTLPSWDKIKPTNFILGHNLDTQVVTFRNGSRIIFFGENWEKDKELNRWKGLEVNGFLLEEINELTQAGYYKAIERAGSYVIKNGEQPPPLILATCNPSKGFIKELVYDRFKAGTLPPEMTYIPATIKDNPFISQEYKDSLKDLPRYEYEVYVNGSWDIQLKTGGEFFKEFDLDRHIGPVRMDPALPVHVSLDENVVPYVTLTIWQIKDKKVYQVGEILAKTPNNTVKKLAKSLIKYLEEKDFTDMVFVYGDRTSLKEDTKLEKGQNFFTIFQREVEEGFRTRLRLPRVNPSVAISGSFINAVLEKDFDGIEILIGEHCKESINDYVETKENAEGGVLKVKVKDSQTGQTYEQNGHILDTARYLICEAFKTSYLKYQSKAGSYVRVLGSTRNISPSRR